MTTASSVINNPKIVVALDYPTMAEALQMAEQLSPEQCRVKVGKELFTVAGPEIVKSLHALGFEVFLDLKFHDIPNTVAKAVAAAANLGVWMVNVHASGGEEMMRAAKAALAEFSKPPLLIAVTVLTSMQQSDFSALGINRSIDEQVKLLAGLAQKSGLDGVVCSAQETEMLQELLGKEFVLVTPGIRPQGADVGDQKRVVTPQQAMQNGSHYLVMGRPITKADNPLGVLQQTNQEIAYR